MPGWRKRSDPRNIKHHPEPNSAKCKICGRRPIKITKHHLIPRETRPKVSTVVKLCRTCHAFLHTQFKNDFLAKHLNTLDKLAANDQVRRFSAYAAKAPVFEIYSRMEIQEILVPCPPPSA